MASLLGAALCSAVLAGCGATGSQPARSSRHPRPGLQAPSTPAPSLGRFAGYVWYGDVHSVQGSWTVPQVLLGSGRGQAGTWIGAQTSSSQDDSPFIQVGTSEGRFSSTDGRHESDVYWAFWTDTLHHFLPITLFPVRAGDRIAATMTLRGGEWTISIGDLSTRTSATFSTTEEAPYTFLLGEWDQEDVGTVKKAGPYPLLTPLTVLRMRVNGQQPRAADLLPVWMSSNQGILAPSRLADGSFTLRQVTIGPSATRYLIIATAENQACRTFAWEIERWTPRTPLDQIASQQAACGRLLEVAITNLFHIRWPPAANQPVNNLIGQTEALWALTTGRARPHDLAHWKALWLRQLNQLISTDREVRTALQLSTVSTQ